MLRLFRGAGVAARLAMILMILMLLAVGASVGWYIKDRSDAATHLFAQSSARRINNVTPLLEQASVGERRALIRAVSGPSMRVRLAKGPPPPDPDLRRHPELMQAALRMLRPLHPRPVVLGRVGDRGRGLFGRGRWRDRRDGRGGGIGGDGADAGDPDLLPSRAKMIVATRLADGQWVHFVLATDLTSLRWAVRTGFWILAISLAIVLFSVWAAYRATRPVRRMAEAAERLGLDVDAPPLNETGSRELRAAARAFNIMQQRVKRLVDDRTLMLAALSHDLKTMLTRLRLRAEFIEDADQRAKAVGDIDDMDMMVDSALGFIRGDQAREPVVRLDLSALIRGLVEDGRAQGQDIVYQGPQTLWATGRPVALKRAVANLIDNAVRYGGGARLSLGAAAGRLELAVTDRGPGLPPAELEKVFRPFYRVEASRSRDTGGSGLGLALAREVFRRLGGDLSLTNAPEGGLIAAAWLPGEAGRPIKD